MSYDIKEVQKIVNRLLQYSSCLDEAFADMGTIYKDGLVFYNDVGDEYRRILTAFANDTTI